MPTSELIGAWVAVGLTLCMYSFLYKDNPFFKLGEHLYVGVSIGYLFSQYFFQSVIPKWYDPLFKEGHLELIIPTILGLLLLTRLIPKYAWLTKISIAFIMGYGAGVSIPRAISTYLLQQTKATVVPLISKTQTGIDWSAGALFTDFSNLLIVVGVIAVLIYFFFSIEHKGVVGKISRLGIVFLMVSFGASYGYTTMARMSLLYGRCYELYTYRTGKYYYATYIILTIIVLTILITEIIKRRKLKPTP